MDPELRERLIALLSGPWMRRLDDFGSYRCVACAGREDPNRRPIHLEHRADCDLLSSLQALKDAAAA